MSGEVVGVGLYSTVKAFFFDQTFVAVVGESVAVAVFVDQGGEVALGVVFVAQEVSAGGLSTHCGHVQLFATAVDLAILM